MSSNFTVIYDACVLYPAPLRDLLMRLALTESWPYAPWPMPWAAWRHWPRKPD